LKKVIVVDDTKNIRTLLSKCLQMEKYEVKTASDGHEAVEMFSKESFDLAFLDIKMPFFSGTEVLKQIREMGIMTPVIIITAYATVKNAVECTRMGAVAYLQKPFSADKVRNILAELEELTDHADKNYQVTAEKLINEKRFTEALYLLKKVIAENPLKAEAYLLLSRSSE
jgi:DNA-binding NtrC family response regulator